MTPMLSIPKNPKPIHPIHSTTKYAPGSGHFHRINFWSAVLS